MTAIRAVLDALQLPERTWRALRLFVPLISLAVLVPIAATLGADFLSKESAAAAVLVQVSILAAIVAIWAGHRQITGRNDFLSVYSQEPRWSDLSLWSMPSIADMRLRILKPWGGRLASTTDVFEEEQRLVARMRALELRLAKIEVWRREAGLAWSIARDEFPSAGSRATDPPRKSASARIRALAQRAAKDPRSLTAAQVQELAANLEALYDEEQAR